MSKSNPTSKAADALRAARLFRAWYDVGCTLEDAIQRKAPLDEIVKDFRQQGHALAREAERRDLDGTKILEATQRVVSRVRRAVLDCGGDGAKFLQLVLSRGGFDPLLAPEGTRLMLRLEAEAAEGTGHGKGRLPKCGADVQREAEIVEFYKAQRKEIGPKSARLAVESKYPTMNATRLRLMCDRIRKRSRRGKGRRK